MLFNNTPMFTGGDKIKFYCNFGDYNNNLKTLSLKPKLVIRFWVSHK